MTTWSAVIVSPVPVSRVRTSTKRAWPSKSVTLALESARQLRPPIEIGSIRPKIRSRTSGQRTPSNRVSTPSALPWAADRATSAG